MKRESGLAAFATALFALFFLTTLHAAPAASRLAKPDFARVKAVSPFEIDLTWRDHSNNEDGFQIERSTDRTNFRQIAQVLPGTTVFRDKNLFPGTRYFYRIRAFNGSGSSRYDTTSARTQTPVVPLSIAQWGDFIAGSPPTNNDLVAIAAGAYHSLALRADGTVIGWGDNFYGQSTPPTNLTGVIGIAAGEYHSLALKNDGTVVGWGLNGWGQATPPPDLTGVVALAASAYHSLALKSDGTVVGWGQTNTGAATPPPGLNGVVAITTTPYYSLALKSDGTVVAWGTDLTGGLQVPTNLNSVVAIAANGNIATALKSDGTLVAWGGYQSYLTTLSTSNLTDVVDVGLGQNQGIALKNDGTLFTWTYGYPTILDSFITNNILAISVRDSHFLALSTAPAAPSNPFVTVLSANQLRLTWRDNSTDEKSFAIERYSYDDNTGAITPFTQIGTVGANATNFVDNAVQAGVIYTYRIRAIGKFGASPYSTSINVQVSPTLAPDDFSVTLGDTNQVNLSWYDPFSGIDSFKIERALNVNGPWTEIASQNVTNSLHYTFTDSTVQPNNTYWYQVRAANVVGLSDYSFPVSINVAPPATPGNFYGSTFADSIQFYWYLGDTARGTKIERAPDVNGMPGAWTQIAMLDVTNGVSYTDRGLSLGTTYWYRARAYNWVGDSDYTAPTHITIVLPAPPTSVNVSVGSTNGVDLTWYPAISDQDGFKLERAPDVDGAPGAWTEIATLNDSHAYSESFHDVDVLANQTYWYRIRSFNLLGTSAYSTPVSIALLPPPAPMIISATPFADSVNLQWQESDPNLLRFKIERAPDAGGTPGSWTQIAVAPGGNAGYNDPSLVPGAVYWYRIVAVNWIGDSPYSNLAAATIAPPATPSISAISLNSSNGVDLTIYDPQSDETGILIERAIPSALGFVDWTQIAKFDSVFYLTTYYFTDTNAATNSTNLYRVRAFNNVGTSDYSSPGSIAIVPPVQPFLQGYAHSDTANLTWYDQSFVSEATLGYRLQRAPDVGGSPGAWTQIAVINGGYYNYNYIDTGLAPSTTYWYRVQSFNWVGASDFSIPWSIMGNPATPAFFQNVALSVTNHQVDLYWFDSGADEDGVSIERAIESNGVPGVWSQIGTMYATNSYYGSFSDTNAVAYTTSWYRARAFNANGFSDYSTEVYLWVIPPSPPNYFFATPFGNQVTLSWVDSNPDHDGVIGYKIERAPDVNGSPGAWTQLNDTANSHYIDPNLTAGAAYWYRIRAYNWVGDSEYTDPISSRITPPRQPTNLYTGVGTNQTVLLQWSDFYHDENGFSLERSGDAGGQSDGNWHEIAVINAPQADQATFVDTNIAAYTTNWYRVRAFSSTGFSSYYGNVESRVIPPPVPQVTSVWPYQNTAQVSWYDDFSIGVGGFVIQRALDNGGVPGTWEDIATRTNYEMSYTDTGLSSGATYWYRVRAFNWVGSSEFSSPASITVLGLAAPAQPYSLYGYPGPSTNQFLLYWYDYSADVDGYRIQRAPGSGGAPGDWTDIGTNDTAGSSFFNDTNFPANVTNWYRIQAFNTAGTSPFSEPLAAAVNAPASAPWFTKAAPINPNVIDVIWQADSGFIQGYKVERAPDVGGAPGNWTLVATSPNTYITGGYQDLAVVQNQKYWYRVQSYNWAGASPYSNPVLVNDAPPATPSSLAITNNQPHQFYLSWSITNNNYIDSVKIERAPDNSGVPGTWLQIAELTTLSGTAPTNYTDIGIPTGQTYWYRVRAVNAVGDSPYSNPASATAAGNIPALSSVTTQPRILSLTPTNGGMLIQWSTIGGSTDVVQASENFANGYTNLSPALIIDGAGVATMNYFDPGASTNSPTRFYRIKSTR